MNVLNLDFINCKHLKSNMILIVSVKKRLKNSAVECNVIVQAHDNKKQSQGRRLKIDFSKCWINHDTDAARRKNVCELISQTSRITTEVLLFKSIKKLIVDSTDRTRDCGRKNMVDNLIENHSKSQVGQNGTWRHNCVVACVCAVADVISQSDQNQKCVQCDLPDTQNPHTNRHNESESCVGSSRCGPLHVPAAFDAVVKTSITYKNTGTFRRNRLAYLSIQEVNHETRRLVSLNSRILREKDTILFTAL